MRLKKFFTGTTSVQEIRSEVREHLLTDVERWKRIYAGGGEWRYTNKGGLDPTGKRRVACLGAAKMLCTELAALCFSAQVDIGVKDTAARGYLDTVLHENGFWRCFPVFLEKMFALGGGVVKASVRAGKVKLDYIPCDGFVPVQYDDGGIYGGIIVSGVERGDKHYVLLEKHLWEDTGAYTIKNELYTADGKPVRLGAVFPGLESETTVTGLKKPLFVYFKPASADNLGDTPFGVSVFANAADILKSLDIAFDSMEREFVLGRKRIIVPVSALRGEYDEKGNIRRYFDAGDEVYQAFSANDHEDLRIQDNSAGLRVNEHVEALECLMDLLCMQVGLSQGTMSYRGTTTRTAAEVNSRGTKTHRTKTAHQQLIREGLIELFELILLLGKVCGEVAADVDGAVSVAFADSVTEDNTAKIDNALKLFGAGVISRERALAEVYGLDPDEIGMI